MSAHGSPKSPSTFKKPAPPGSQRKILQNPPAPLNASQASHLHNGSQSPYRGRSPALQPDFGRGEEDDVQERNEPQSEDNESEANMAKEDDNEIQAPSTNPDRHLTTPASKSSGTRTLLPSERGTSPAQTSDAQDSDDQELQDFNMIDFQKRYYEDLCAINRDEQEIMVKFERFAETFAAWAQSASARDTDRASKRLKTRETFVVMAEHLLEDKREHYEQVVRAFQAAMQLLRT